MLVQSVGTGGELLQRLNIENMKSLSENIFFTEPGLQVNNMALHNYILGAPPLGLVQFGKIISPHQIIVQT